MCLFAPTIVLFVQFSILTCHLKLRKTCFLSWILFYLLFSTCIISTFTSLPSTFPRFLFRWLLVIKLNLIDVLLKPWTFFCVVVYIKLRFFFIVFWQDICQRRKSLLSSCWAVLLRKLNCTMQIYSCDCMRFICIQKFLNLLFFSIISSSNMYRVAFWVMGCFWRWLSLKRWADIWSQQRGRRFSL